MAPVSQRITARATFQQNDKVPSLDKSRTK